jgi:hypothetical protein
MKLYMAVPIAYARRVVTNGFAGDPDVKFRDIPSQGLTRSVNVDVEWTADDVPHETVTPGPRLEDDIGDLTLVIDMPGTDVQPFEARYDPPQGYPFREYWLPPELANRYRHTLRVFVPLTDEEIIPPTLLLQDHAVIVTERFAEYGPDHPAVPVSALCTCGERWRWSFKDDALSELRGWLAGHHYASLIETKETPE